MEASLGPGIAAALARTASLLRSDADALDDLAQDAFVAALERDGSAGVALPVEVLAGMSIAVRSRVLRLAAVAAGAPTGAVTHDHVRAMLALIDDWHGQGPVALPGGVEVSRSYGRLTLHRRSRAEPIPTDTSET